MKRIFNQYGEIALWRKYQLLEQERGRECSESKAKLIVRSSDALVRKMIEDNYIGLILNKA